MAKKINGKLVLELLGKGMSGREIARTRHIAPQSVKKVREAAEAKGVSWEDVERMGEREVYDLLFPGQAEAESACMRSPGTCGTLGDRSGPLCHSRCICAKHECM